MPLEDIEGPGKFPNDLNSAWPLGSDTPSEGDDHLRGIKNVIRNWAGTYGDGPLSDLLTAAFAPLVHTHLWEDITDPPAAFPPLAHTHLAEDVTDLGDVLADYAPLEAPALTGNATIDGAVIASQDYVQGEVHKPHEWMGDNDYTLTADDIGRSLMFSGLTTNRTLTLPNDLNIPMGARINVGIWTGSEFKLTIVAEPGDVVGLLSRDWKASLSATGQGATLEKMLNGTGEFQQMWWLVGDLE